MVLQPPGRIPQHRSSFGQREGWGGGLAAWAERAALGRRAERLSALLAVLVREVSAPMGELLAFAPAFLTLSLPGLTSCQFVRWKY